jgi:hypothetical protein
MPNVIRSLGAVLPSRPKADDGMIVGSAMPTAEADFKKSRRD